MSLKEFQVLCKLGEGAYSSVYRVSRIADNCEYALKKVKMTNLNEKEKMNALNEVRILASIRNNNIIQYKEAFVDDGTNSLCIIMEYANNGDLLQSIQEHAKANILFNENEIWNIFIQVAKGLKSLHDLKIFHRDLKSANVFIFKDGTAKLGDMNVSKVAKKGMLYTQTGTPYYASPEVWKDHPYDFKSDIWSLGCVLYEMANLKTPFRAESMDALYQKVIKGSYPKIHSCFSHDLAMMIKTLLQINPIFRPTTDSILQMIPVVQRMEEKHLIQPDEGNQFLLQTIKIPKMGNFYSDLLPKPNYSLLKTKKVEKQKFIQNLSNSKVYLASDSQLQTSIHDEQKLTEKVEKAEKFEKVDKIMLPKINMQTLPQQERLDNLSMDLYLNNQKNIKVASPKLREINIESIEIDRKIKKLEDFIYKDGMKSPQGQKEKALLNYVKDKKQIKIVKSPVIQGARNELQVVRYQDIFPRLKEQNSEEKVNRIPNIIRERERSDPPPVSKLKSEIK